MNLVIDIGNTRIKVATFEGSEFKSTFVLDATLAEENKLHNELISLVFAKSTISKCILASVVDPVDSMVDFLKQYSPTLLFTGQTATPLKNEYKSAATLGSDRLASAVGGNVLFPNQTLLVIDAGTCIKYNLVHEDTYIGGAISPGLKMRFKALHTFTSRLPLLEPQEQKMPFIGTNTNESIVSGAAYGALLEIEGFIEQYKAQYPGIKIILTGGDAIFFEKRMKKPIFTDQYLIMKGLNAILEYNSTRI